MEGLNASSSSCTLTYVGGIASLSCVDSTSSGYQVILLQDNDPYNLAVVNVRPGEKQTVPVVPSGRYCVMELPMGDYNDTEIKYSREFAAEFTAEETPAQPSTVDIIGIASKLVSALSVCIDITEVNSSICHNYSCRRGTVHIHDIDHTNNCGMCGYYQDKDKNMEVSSLVSLFTWTS